MDYKFELNGNEDYATLHVSERITPVDARYSHEIDSKRPMNDTEKLIYSTAGMARGIHLENVNHYSIVCTVSRAIDRNTALQGLVEVLKREGLFAGQEWNFTGMVK